MSKFSEKLSQVKAQLSPESSLMIVTKMRSLDEIREYYRLGHRDFGENRVQDLVEKADALRTECPGIRWHMIGHLQSNKINQLFSVNGLVAIHSVHDQELVEKLIKAEDRLINEVDVYLQMNTSLEEAKSGFETHQQLVYAAQTLRHARKLRLKGLMTMGKIRTDDFEKDAQRCFSLLAGEKRLLENDLNIVLETSMGMSQDYRIALANGSNWIRLGSVMFE